MAGSLEDLGLRPGDKVRWRPGSSGPWRSGTVKRRERDGSVLVSDAKGAARSLPVSAIEARAAGPRGADIWEAVSERVGRPTQLPLL